MQRIGLLSEVRNEEHRHAGGVVDLKVGLNGQ